MEDNAKGSSECLEQSMRSMDPNPERVPRRTAFALTKRLRLRKITYRPRSNPRSWVTSKSCGRLVMEVPSNHPRCTDFCLGCLVQTSPSIYQAFGSDYPMSREEYLSVANGCRQPWEQLRSTMSAVGERIGPERLTELSASLGRDTIFVLGSRLQKEPNGIFSAIQAFHRVLAKSFA